MSGIPESGQPGGGMFGKFFGQYLIERRMVTPTGLAKALAGQTRKNLPLGALALERGVLTPEEVEAVLDRQLATDAPFGETAVALGVLTATELDGLVRVQMREHLYLGQALVDTGILPPAALARELQAFHQENAGLGQALSKIINGSRGGLLVRNVAETVGRYVARAVSGHVRVAATEPRWLRFPAEVCVMVRKRGLGAPAFDYGLAMERRYLLALAYCLLARPTLATRTIDEALGEFVAAVDESLCRRLEGEGWRYESERPTVCREESMPGPQAVCLALSSSIGEFGVFVEVRPEDWPLEEIRTGE